MWYVIKNEKTEEAINFNHVSSFKKVAVESNSRENYETKYGILFNYSNRDEYIVEYFKGLEERDNAFSTFLQELVKKSN